MSTDRYMKIILTVIALELGWMAIKDATVDVSAQQAAPTPVIITGVQMPGTPPLRSLPVTLVGTTGAVRVNSDRPLQVEAPQPLTVEAVRPIVVQTGDKPLLVRSVQAAAAPRPGE
jgi:hypothetical protein